MPLQQFDERVVNVTNFWFDDTATPLLPGSMGLAIGPDQRFDVIMAANNDTINHIVGFTFVANLTRGVIGSVTVPAGAGYGAVPPVDVLAAMLPTAQPFLLVESNGDRFCFVGETINTGKIVSLYLQGGFF